MNYYDILRVSHNVTDEELKKAYQELVRKYHPDKSRDIESNAEFLKIDKAYKVLKDKVERKIYDSELFQKSKSHLIIHDTVARSQFSFDDEDEIYYFQCKCGSFYTLDNENLTNKEDVILSCDECSLNILVKNYLNLVITSLPTTFQDLKILEK